MRTKIAFRSDMGVEHVQHMGSDERIAQAARTSTQGLNQSKSVGLVRALWRDGHFSPFESSALTIALNVPLFVRDQIVRHKSLAFSVFSLRYSEARPEFWLPAKDRPLVQVGKSLDYRREEGTPEQVADTHAALRLISERAWNNYQFMLDEGITAEVARTSLPTNLYTSMWATGSLRSWLHFLHGRMDKHAQIEIQQTAQKVAHIIAEHWPVTFEAFMEEER